MRDLLLCLLLLWMAPASGAELVLSFATTREHQTPEGFRSALMGEGKPGDWRVVMETTPPEPASAAPAPVSARRYAVLGQLAQDPTDEHFPMLIYERETFGDFTLTTRFKIVGGQKERMAGIAFHVQNETNYYVVRASSLGNNLRFYKVLNGQRGPLVGPEMVVPTNVWQELTIETKGNDIRCLLNGKEQIKVMDKVNAFTGGKVAFWTKSDSVAYFADTRIAYATFETRARKLVDAILKEYPRLLGLEIYVADSKPATTRLLAAKDKSATGRPGRKVEWAVLREAQKYYGKEKGMFSVVLPMRDRNGDPMAAVRVRMKSYPGQTEASAVMRAVPIVKEMEKRVQTLADLLE